MATTTPSTPKTKPDPNLTRTRSLGRKPKPGPSSEPGANGDESEKKPTEKKNVPNYLKPTISSRPDPVKFLKKNHGLDDNNRKILRRRSFDHPPSSMTSSSTSLSRKSLNTSPARPRDKPMVPREKPATTLRSTSSHGSSRGGLKGSSTARAPPVASKGSPGVKKSLSLGGTSSSKNKKVSSENVPKKSSGKEITPETSPLASAHEDEEEVVKVETEVQVSDEGEEPKGEEKDHVAQSEESGEEKDQSDHVDDVSKEEEEKGELINEDKTEDKVEETEEPENTQENNSEDKEDVEQKVDDEVNSETVVLEVKETENVEESKEEEEAEAEVKEEESESSKVEEETTETKAPVEEELPEEGTKKEVMQGKKESPTAYNDVIASKMQANPRKNKVLALAGAFQTVIDYETAASK